MGSVQHVQRMVCSTVWPHSELVALVAFWSTGSGSNLHILGNGGLGKVLWVWGVTRFPCALSGFGFSG